MIGQVRTAHPAIILNGKNYYEQLAPYLIGLTYSDNCDGEKADDLQFQLADRDRKFINEWMPDVGAFFDVSIIAERWFAPYAAGLSLDCGRFWVDSVEFALPDHTVTVKATSLPTGIRIKAANETRGWDNGTLQDIAQQICGENQLELDWQSDINPRYTRIEQNGESGLQFLKKRAEDAKLSIKAHRGTLVFFDEEKYEDKAAVFTIMYGNTQVSTSGLPVYRIEEAHFTIRLVDGLKKATVKNVDIYSGKLKTGQWTAEELLPPGPATIPPPEAVPPTGIAGGGAVPAGSRGAGTVQQSDIDQAAAAREDNLHDNPGDDDSGEDEGDDGGGRAREAPTDGLLVWTPPQSDSNISRKAKAHLRNRNKHNREATIKLSIGNPLIAAGMTCNLNGLGQYDGKWFVESAKHEVGPEYTTELKVRTCLKGY